MNGGSATSVLQHWFLFFCDIFILQPAPLKCYMTCIHFQYRFLYWGILWHCFTGAAGGVTITRRACAVVFRLCLRDIAHMPAVSFPSWHFLSLVTQELRELAEPLTAVTASVTRLNACWKSPRVDDSIRIQARRHLPKRGLQWLLISS